MECRPGCGACCIAMSISSPIPGMPPGKPAGTRCIQLDEQNKCKLFNKPERPPVCFALKASPEMCGSSFDEALTCITFLEEATRSQ